MMIKTTSVLGSMVAAVSFAADQMDPSTNQASSKDEIATLARITPLVSDTMTTVLSFCTPLQWSQLFSVNRFFYDLTSAVIAEFKQDGWDFEYSSNLDISETMDRMLKQPVPSKTLIANKRNLVMLQIPEIKEESELVLSPKVRITGIDTAKEYEKQDRSDCEGYFLHRKQPRSINVRNMETGEEITLVGRFSGCESTVINKNQVVCVCNTELWLYHLDWEEKKAERVLCQNLKSGTISEWCALKNQCGEAESVLYYGSNLDRMGEYDLIQREFRWTKSVKGKIQFVPGGQTVIEKQRNQIKIESTDGNTQLLCLPTTIQSDFSVSPDGRYASFLLATKQRVLQNLYNGVLTFIDAPMNPQWITPELFKISQFFGPTCLRSVKKPGVNLITLNKKNTDKMDQLKQGSIVEAQDILHDDLTRLGQNLFLHPEIEKDTNTVPTGLLSFLAELPGLMPPSQHCKPNSSPSPNNGKVIQLEWID